MILVTGTKRSGTSMWMQALQAAGLPLIAEAFPKNWGESALREANPAGFFETTLRDGISWHTNPDPNTGVYLHPHATEGHVVKVFLPGLARTDLAFVEAVVFTLRDWRSQCTSVARLLATERRAAGAMVPESADRPRLAHALEWWAENFIGLRDLIARGYPVFLVSYDAVVSTPEEVLPRFVDWLGRDDLDVQAAVAAVRGDLRRSEPAVAPDGLDPDVIEVFDALHQRVHAGQGFDEAFLDRLDDVNQRLAPLIRSHLEQAERHRQGQP